MLRICEAIRNAPNPYSLSEFLVSLQMLQMNSSNWRIFRKRGDTCIHAYMYRGGESTKKQNNRKSSVTSVTLAYIQPEIPARVAKKLLRMFVAESVTLREKS